MMYRNGWKRVMDFALSFMALLVLSPVFLILIVLGVCLLGGNPFFTQFRPGKKDPKTGREKIFRLIKFRTMTNKKDADGNLLPDEERMTPYGSFLRSTSLDELPELLNILKGDMSLVGPRPQLVRDMTFMSEEERRRHDAVPGLTGLAQVSGRNNNSWEKKFEYDLKYVEKITFFGDVKILFQTVGKVFLREGITEEGMVTAQDLGDYLLEKGVVSQAEYEKKQEEAKELIRSR